MTSYRLYGATLRMEHRLRLRAPITQASPDVTVTVVETAPVAAWDGAQERYTTPPRRGAEQPDFRFFQLPDRDVIRIEDTGDVHLLDDTIVFHLREADHAFLIEIVLLGLAMAFWLERRGTAVLHGAACSLEGDAVGFLAPGGTGKSSLATFLTAGGDPLITEDLLRVSWHDGAPFAEPGVGQLRLWPDQAARYASDWEALEQPHPGFAKRKLPVGTDGIGTLAAERVALRGLYILERTDDPSYEPNLIRLPRSDAVAELLTHSYLPQIDEGFGWQSRRFGQLVELCRSVPVTLLRFRSGYDQLPVLRDAIATDLAR